MELIVTIPFALPTANEVIGASKKHWSGYAKAKQSHTDTVALLCRGKKPLATPANFLFVWHRKRANTDPDNICFGAKYVFDGFVKARLLPDDSPRYIKSIAHQFEYGVCDGVEVYAVTD